MEIPEKINNFNAYLGTVEAGTKCVGISDEVTLPNLENLTETLSMAGMAGEIDSPVVGQYKACTIEIPFKNISVEMFKLAADDNTAIILRAAQESVDTSTNQKSFKSRVITVRGMTKSINFGSLKKGGYGNPSITKEVVTYQDIYDNKVLADVNKWGTSCIMNGVDIAKGISDLI